MKNKRENKNRGNERVFDEILIGNKVKIIESADPSLIERSGKVVDETRNMIKISDERNNSLLIPKAISVFELEIENRRTVLSGKEIVGTLEERVHRL
jgi:RNase P/RNase MRP subunit p29